MGRGAVYHSLKIEQLCRSASYGKKLQLKVSVQTGQRKK
jgi:hypothetical protein